MEVKISFDTEKESVDDIKKLIFALQDLVNKREKISSTNNSMTHASKPQNIQVQAVQTQSLQSQPNSSGQSAGGSKFTPYIDMSDTMSKIFSGK